MSKRNRDLHQAIASLNESRKKYFNLLDEIKNDRCHFPVIMNICSYDTVKKLPYDELIEVNQIADLKLEKELHKGFFLVYELYDLVNSDEKNLKISNNLKFNKEGKPIYQEGVNNAK
ncbi:DUF1322 family protein [Borreliella bavariensis]|uniref:DUF1322 family protein n=1 Tax=Borreliella bavariensis TaxID=664662 RepID=UPI001BFFF10F|nr:DUF1322 family protein [Borreliella bavariensis]